jgi:predicted ABC-type ATPase
MTETEKSGEPLRAAARLIVVTGPAGAGKSSVAQILVDRFDPSVLVEGDEFFRFLRHGAIEPWLREANRQNEVVTRAAATAAGRYADGGYTTVYDGVVGAWFLPTFLEATQLDQLDYVVLLPTLERCLDRVRTRTDHGFRDEDATRHIHGTFVRADIAPRHVMADPSNDARVTASEIIQGLRAGRFRYPA